MEKLVIALMRVQDVTQSIGLNDVQLPRIVTIGSQSSGKTSVIERLIGCDFLPRGDDIVTRCPIIMNLINQPKKSNVEDRNMYETESGSENEYEYDHNKENIVIKSKEYDGTDDATMWAEFLHSPGKIYRDFKDVCREIEMKTHEIAGKNKGISRIPITLRIYGQGIPTLTLVDLPGITKIAVGDQPENIEDQTIELVMSYIEPKSSIILAICPANIDLANNDSLKLARKVDENGYRTVGVLTKIDLMDKGADVTKILSNEGSYKLRHGFVALMNRNQLSITRGETMKFANLAEKKFFKLNRQYISYLDNCGIENLSTLLSKLLIESLKKQLPHITNEIKNANQVAQAKLNAMSESIDDQIEGLPKLLQMIGKYADGFIAVISGGIAPDTDATNKTSCGSRLSHIFTNDLVESLDAALELEPFGPAVVRDCIRNTNSIFASLFISSAPFDLITKRRIKSMIQPCTGCLSRVCEELHSCLQSFTYPGLNTYPNLQARLYEVSEMFINQCLETSLNYLNISLKVECSYINVSHPDFVTIRRSEAIENCLEKIRDDPCSSEGFRRNLAESSGLDFSEKLLYVLENFMPKKSTALQSLESNKTSKHTIYSSNRKHKDLNSESEDSDDDKPKEEVVTYRDAKEETETAITIKLINAYIEISKKNLIDHVRKVSIYFIINTIINQLKNHLIQHVYNESQLAHLLRESSNERIKRQQLKAQIKAYTDILIYLKSIQSQ